MIKKPISTSYPYLSYLDPSSLPAHLLPLFDPSSFWGSMDPPKPGDWLKEHKETGQTFKSYCSGMINRPTKYKNKVYLFNLDEYSSKRNQTNLTNKEGAAKMKRNNLEVDEEQKNMEDLNFKLKKGLEIEKGFLDEEIMRKLSEMVSVFYPGLEVEVRKGASWEEMGVSKRMNDEYLQYNASEGIEKLSKLLPKDGLLIVGVTSFDIYPREEWNFVFGLADKVRGCGIFSFRRYQDELDTYDLPLLIKLASKVMFHEIGHLLGLKHCIYYKCIMNGSNNLSENLKKPFDFCPVCLRKVFWNLNFNILDRYRRLKEFYGKEGKAYQAEKDWYGNRSSFI